MSDPTLLGRLERYYDTVPRATADGEAVGPFTLFVAREGWPYYARPTLGSDAEFTVDDVREVLARQRRLGVPQHLEWVDEITPTLLPATEAAGVPVARCALMVLSGEPVEPPLDGVSVRLLRPDDDAFASARAAVDAGFGECDTLTAEPVVEAIAAQVQLGRMRVAGAFDPTWPGDRRWQPCAARRRHRGDRHRRDPGLAPSGHRSRARGTARP